ncbi:peptidase T [Elizabethkingia sp. JS20170427COW]|uniref:peptidase T n=1 Tax=Elizabethkingia sp. JS20170427COW TaxID=2583851 RepID=UPI0011101C29|nr:peptidase T [Elizabethkingia sp. JS20170427COW]QCX53035.1 peptidase T [Elizabethkingia sp. JS20170427COW]
MNAIVLDKNWEKKLLDRFLTYVKIYSTSDPESETTPSTPQQWDMINYLYEELKNIGLENVTKDENGYVYGFVPSTVDHEVSQVGFVSHFDSSPDFNGKNVRPQIWENYDGGDLVLNKETNFILSSTKFKEMVQYKGQTLITTDGTSLLSADDKAGIAEIVTAAEYLVAHPEIKHGRISVGFTPDEEIGRGADLFNVEKFGAEWAYTMDGGEIGELEFENFNAAGAVVKIHGLSVHPGYSFGKMVNAGLLAAEFIQSLPANETPATTVGYEGFFHLTDVTADVSEAKLLYIIRDHDDAKYEVRCGLLEQKVAEFNAKYGEGTFELEIKEQYRNMRQMIEDKMYIVDFAEEAMKLSGVKPNIKAIRGGTDGARLSYMGLPCPNIFAGGHNFHGPYEYVPLQSMTKATEVIVNLVQLVAKK